MQSDQTGSIRDFVKYLKKIPNIEAVTVTKQKTHQTGISSLMPSTSSKRDQIESSLIPRIPTTHGPIQPTSILERMKELGVPGVSIAVINHGKIEWSGGYGDLEHSPLVQAGSVSKMINGLVILSLIDQCEEAQKLGHPSGLANNQIITLDTDVSTLLDPELWHSIDPNGITAGDEPKLTIRQLLAHTGGIPGHGGFNGYPQMAIGNTEGMGAVVMTNSASGEHLIDEVIPAIIKAYQWPDGDILPMFQPALQPQELAAIEHITAVDEANWADYIGRYEFDEEGTIHSVQVSVSGGKIMVQVEHDPPFQVTPLTDSMGLYRQGKNGPQDIIRFNRSPDGAVAGLILFGATHKFVPSS